MHEAQTLIAQPFWLTHKALRLNDAASPGLR